MKTKIHPTYFSKAKATCACGATFEVGSTKEVIEVEICSQCHPFYTGKEKLIDTAGKVEKFKARREKAAKAPATRKKSEKRAVRRTKKTNKEAKPKRAPRAKKK